MSSAKKTKTEQSKWQEEGWWKGSEVVKVLVYIVESVGILGESAFGAQIRVTHKKDKQVSKTLKEQDPSFDECLLFTIAESDLDQPLVMEFLLPKKNLVIGEGTICHFHGSFFDSLVL